MTKQLAADEIERHQADWQVLEKLTQNVHQRPSDYSPAQIEAEIGKARAEIKKDRHAPRRGS